MADKKKIKEFIKNEGQKIAYCGVGVAVGVALAVIASKAGSKEGPYKLMVWSDNKDYITALGKFVNWSGGRKLNGAYIAMGQTDSEIRSKIEELLGEDSGDYLYAMVIERLKKE